VLPLKNVRRRAIELTGMVVIVVVVVRKANEDTDVFLLPAVTTKKSAAIQAKE